MVDNPLRLGRWCQVDIKAQIAPKGLEFRPSDFIISDKYATILTVISYPKYIAPGFLSDLTSMSGIKMVIKHIPFAYSEISKMLNKEIADLKENVSIINHFHGENENAKALNLYQKGKDLGLTRTKKRLENN